MNMIVLRSDILFVILSYITLSDGSLFGGKKDCLISNWGVWSKPFGLGVVTRKRTVLRHPTNGGKDCPKLLVEYRISETKPTIKKTAIDMVNHIVKRGANTGKKVGQLTDLLIILDSSGSMGPKGFRTAKTQLAELLALLCPIPDPFKGYQQAALIQYASQVKEVFDFNDKNNTVQIQNAIKSLKYMGGSTCTATAFQRGKLMFDPSKGMRNRSDVKQEVLIITNGKSNCGGDAVKAAQMLQKTADVYGLMIGEGSKRGNRELLSYVTAPLNTHLFGVQGYQNLGKLLTIVKNQLNQQGGGMPCAVFDI